MGSFTLWHWIVVIVLFSLLFIGRGIISELMGDFFEGVAAFIPGVKDRIRDPSYDPLFALSVWLAGFLAIVLAYAVIARLIAR
jgi:sec-independent protein translocase protein TatA